MGRILHVRFGHRLERCWGAPFQVGALITAPPLQALNWTARVWPLQWWGPARPWVSETSIWPCLRIMLGWCLGPMGSRQLRSPGMAKAMKIAGAKQSMLVWLNGYCIFPFPVLLAQVI